MLWIIFAIIVIVGAFIITAKKPRRLSLAGAHVVITGGSSGIGLEIAKQCARQGSFITILARNPERLIKAKEDIRKCLLNNDGSQCIQSVSIDVSNDYETVKKSFENIQEKQGPVDFLFNCAGISHSQIFEDTPIDVFENVMKVNYIGSVNCTYSVVPSMKKRRRGRIVFVSSQAGQLGLYGYSAYSASKFALRGLAETLQMEVKPYNMAVTVSFPPDTDTPGFHSEDETKPEATRLISETAGLHTAEAVAKSIIQSSLTGEYLNLIGLDGFMLGHVSAGMSPCNSKLSLLIQVFLGGVFRLVSVAYLKSFDAIVERCSVKQDSNN